MIFPRIRGRSLAGSDIVVPDDLAGEMNVLLLAFQQRHQSTVDRWIDAVVQAGADPSPPHDAEGRAVPGSVPSVVYEIPLLGAKWIPFRGFIDGGMASGIRVPEVLARTVTAYGQIGPVEAALGLRDRHQVVAVVLRGDEVVAMQRGQPGTGPVLDALG
jgi:hypothetical protein